MFDTVLINVGEIGYETERGYNEFMESTDFEDMAKAYAEAFNN